MTNKPSTPKTAGKAPKPKAGKTAGSSKLDTLVNLMKRPTGATVDELAKATSWQKHSVRGALAGTLKKKGHTITSEVTQGIRRYRITEAQA